VVCDIIQYAPNFYDKCAIHYPPNFLIKMLIMIKLYDLDRQHNGIILSTTILGYYSIKCFQINSYIYMLWND
jgi:hypothetical protein